MQVILLERVDNLGNLGDVVNVKPGYARNYLLPQQKALRATKDNLAYFETRKKEIEKQNETRKGEAAKLAKPLEGLTVTLLRHASEGGQLYGSVTSRDIADAVSAESKTQVSRGQVEMNQTYKSVGLFTATVALHPEVKVDVRINIARSAEEAKIQLKTGRAVISDASGNPIGGEEEASKEAFLEQGALEAEKERSEEEAAIAAEEAEKSAKKSEARAAKKAAVHAGEAEEGTEEAAGEE
jgi:large subunit ribosomal protein L9